MKEAPLSDVQLAHEVCKLMYAPATRATAPLIWMIERLVLPPEVMGYSDKDILGYLLTALRERQKQLSDSPPENKETE